MNPDIIKDMPNNVDWNVWKPLLDEALEQINWNDAGTAGDSLGYSYYQIKGDATDLQLYTLIKESVEEMIKDVCSTDETNECVNDIGYWKLKVTKLPQPKISVKFVITGTED